MIWRPQSAILPSGMGGLALQVFLMCACAFWASAAAQAEERKPLVELLFGWNLRNTGTLGGEGQFVEYVPGEGPIFGPGVRGMGVSFAASSRGGGSDRTKAGGGIRLRGTGLGQLPQMTFSMWLCPIGPNAPARMIYLAPCWDLFIGNGQVALKVKHGGQDVVFQTRGGEPPLRDGGWSFIAVTMDRATGEGRCYHAIRGEELRLIASWQGIPAPDTGEGDLEIGNLEGIRPFRGYLDNVRIHDRALSQEEIAGLCRTDPRPSVGLKAYAQDVPAPAPIFERSDVCLSSRSRHPNSVETIQGFRANQLLWCYTAEQDFIAQCKSAGIKLYQGAINSIPGTKNTQAQAIDLDGNPVIAPWMVCFDKRNPWYWGCHNRPLFMELSVERARKALQAGADMIQFDDWYMTVGASMWGGACFCEECMAAFRADLKQQLSPAQLAELGITNPEAFDYRQHLRERHQITTAAAYKAAKQSLPTTPHFEAFQRRSDRRFFAELRRRINAEAGRVVPLSVNTTLVDPSQRANFLTDIMDFVQGETLRFPLAELAMGAKTAEGLGKWHVFVPESDEVAQVRAGIAASYALGQFLLVPWDMYMGSDATGIRPRGWGTVAQYGDLYHFVRDNPALLNGYETAATVGLVVNLDFYDRGRAIGLCRRLLDAQVPFAVLPVGHSYYDAPLRRERLARFDALLVLNAKEEFSPSDWAEIEAADVSVLSDHDASEECLRSFSPFEVWGPKDIHILPRVKRDAQDRTLLCHVLSGVETEGAQELKWVSFVVQQKAFLGARVVSVRCHVPGEPPVDVECERVRDGLRVLLPKLPRCWGIVEMKFE